MKPNIEVNVCKSPNDPKLSDRGGLAARLLRKVCVVAAGMTGRSGSLQRMVRRCGLSLPDSELVLVLKSSIRSCLYVIRNVPMSETQITDRLLELKGYRAELRKLSPQSEEATPLSLPFFPPVACREVSLPFRVELAACGYRETSTGCSIDRGHTYHYPSDIPTCKDQERALLERLASLEAVIEFYP